jgi:hypothetical protein
VICSGVMLSLPGCRTDPGGPGPGGDATPNAITQPCHAIATQACVFATPE